jgi:hypothetical protein
MKKKIIGFFICLILITSILTAAKNVDYKPVMKLHDVDMLLIDEDDVPIWHEGDKWSYRIDTVDIDFEKEDILISLNAQVDNLLLEVEKVTEFFYQLKIDAPISGDFVFITNLDNNTINITGELKSTTIGGFITFNKTNLGLKQVHVIIDGKVSLKVNEIFNYPFPLIPPIPIPLTVTIDINLSKHLPIIDFPINTSKNWGLPSTSASLSGTIDSIWLKIISFVNNIIRFPWVIELLATLTAVDPVTLQIASDILYNLTPTLDFKYLLDVYLGGNVFEIPEVPPLLFCLGRDNITVPAGGPFNSYNISLMNGFGNIYYSPEVGSIVKIIGNFEDVLPFVSNINAELISYQYAP